MWTDYTFAPVGDVTRHMYSICRSVSTMYYQNFAGSSIRDQCTSAIRNLLRNLTSAELSLSQSPAIFGNHVSGNNNNFQDGDVLTKFGTWLRVLWRIIRLIISTVSALTWLQKRKLKTLFQFDFFLPDFFSFS